MLSKALKCPSLPLSKSLNRKKKKDLLPRRLTKMCLKRHIIKTHQWLRMTSQYPLSQRNQELKRNLRLGL
jgi:hypothetical protein